HPGRGVPRPAPGRGVLLRRDPHHVPDGLVRGAVRDAGLDRAQLHGHVPAQGPQAPLSVRPAALVAVLITLVARPAGAVNHLIAIDEVLGSWQDDDSVQLDRKSTRLNSSHDQISYAVFCLKNKKKKKITIYKTIKNMTNTKYYR